MKKIKTDQNKLLLFTHYSDRRKAAQLPKARWRPKQKCWSTAKTPATWSKVKDFWPEEANAALEDPELQDLEQKLKARQQLDTSPEPDYGYYTTPWEHQIPATRAVRDWDAVLLDAWMGVGKTKVTLDGLGARGSEQILILCPKSVITVWEDEIGQHYPDWWQFLPLDSGSVQDRTEELQDYLKLYDRVIAAVNYEASWRDPLDDIILDTDWDTLVLDESHRLKSPSSKQSHFAAKIPTDHKVALTGTPMPHSPLDLYGQYRTLDVGIFGSRFTRFRSRYAIMGGYEGRQVLDYQNEEELREQMDRICYHIPKDALDLPEIQTVDRPVKLEPETKKKYTELSQQLITQVEEGVVTAANALSKLIRLAQVTSGFVKTEAGEEIPLGSAKRDMLKDLLTDLEGERVVVFGRFRRDLQTIQDIADSLDRETAEISGRVNQYEEWQENPNKSVLAVQPKSGSLGIDLTGAAYVIFYSMGYSLGDYQQAVARVHRPGQDRPVTIFRIVAKATVDTQIIRAIDKRAEVVEYILSELGGGDN